MKTALRLFLVSCAFGCTLQGCVAPLAKSLPRRAAFPAANEKIFISTAIDSSSLETFPGWPSEKNLQAPLISALKKLDSNMLVEFRRCEKYGLYELVDDSLLSSVRVSLVIGRYQFKKDTLTMPVRMTIEKPALKKNLTRTISAMGIYRAKTPPKSPLHYLDMLLADFCRNFPYSKAAEVFYRPSDKPRPGIAKNAAR